MAFAKFTDMKDIIKFFTPVIYIFIWILLIKFAGFLGLKVDDTFLIISLIILFFGTVSKSTSWAIGHDKFGVKGDSTSKKIEYCADGIGTIKIFDDDLDARKELMVAATKEIISLKNKK